MSNRSEEYHISKSQFLKIKKITKFKISEKSEIIKFKQIYSLQMSEKPQNTQMSNHEKR